MICFISLDNVSSTILKEANISGLGKMFKQPKVVYTAKKIPTLRRMNSSPSLSNTVKTIVVNEEKKEGEATATDGSMIKN